MTIALAQKNSFMQGAGGSSTPCTYVNAAQTAHNCNVVYVNGVAFFSQVVATVTSVTDTSGNTYTKIAGGQPTISLDMEIWVCADIAAAAINTNIVTVNWSSGINGENAVFILEYSGLSNAIGSISDGTPVFSTGSTGSGNQTSGSITTTNANDVLVAGSVHRTGGGAPAFVSPFVNEGPLLTTTDSADQIVSATGSYSATIVGGSANRWGILLVALKAPSSGSGLLVTSGMDAFFWS